MGANRWRRFSDWDERPLRLDKFAVEDPDYIANVLWTQMLGVMHLARSKVGVRQASPGVPQLFVILVPSFLLFDDLMAEPSGWVTVVWVLLLGILAAMPIGMVIGAAWNGARAEEGQEQQATRETGCGHQRISDFGKEVRRANVAVTVPVHRGGVLALLIVIGSNLFRLVVQYRAHVTGSRALLARGRSEIKHAPRLRQ